ncbi:MAG: MFS transporter [Deltaproteobacteria bacterium]
MPPHNDQPQESPAAAPPPAESDPLPDRFQQRNSLVFIVNMSLIYLVAPVFYVGVLHAAICNSLGASDTVANLPASVNLWMTPIPVFISWLWPSPLASRRILVAAYLVVGMAGGVAAASFVAAPRHWLIPVLVAHAGIVGVTVGVIQMCLWELIGRGMTTTLRGWTLSLTFGAGPVFAVLGSCASQLILSGKFLNLVEVSPIPEPWSYVLLFGVTAPAMWLAAGMVSLARLPPGSEPAPRTGGIAFAQGIRLYFTHPLILIAAFGFLCTYAGGGMIMNNLALYAREAIGEPPERYSGLQLALRFGFKSVCGFGLGWLVTRVHAKAPLVATTTICLAGVGWALLVPGKWYLLSFGLLGAGELFYVYYMNYIVSCSAPERMRENTAYTNLITVTVGFVPLMYGGISDRFGLRSSFVLAMAILIAACVVAGLFLPRQPSPRSAEPAA